MTVPDGFYTTKVTVEVEVTHQFDPCKGIGIITSRLTGHSIPAVKSVKVIEASSNYQLHSKPLEEMVALEFVPYIFNNETGNVTMKMLENS